jgi:Tol biopolymer transport system component
MRPIRAAALAAVAILMAPTTADASYPGTDGRIAFVRSSGIYSATATGAGVLRLTAAAGDSQPVWSPNGRRIAFVRAGDVWTMNANGSRETRVTTSAATEASPTWSPDGAWIAFASDRAGFWLWNVYKLRSTTPFGSAIRLTFFAFDPDQGECPANHSPGWGTNGRIAFVHDQFFCDDFATFPELYTMNAAGGARASLDESCRCYGDQLDWAPNGRSFLFVNNNLAPDAANPFDFDGSDIWRRTTPGALRNLSSGIPRWYYDEAPAASPSGTRIVFQSTFQNAVNRFLRGIWVMDADGTHRARILAVGTDPNWGPAP